MKELNELKSEICPNPQCAQIHTRTKMPVVHGLLYQRGGSAFVDEMLTIPGVIQCSVDLYSVSVHKAPLFRWEEIFPDAMRIVGEHVAKIELAKGMVDA